VPAYQSILPPSFVPHGGSLQVESGIMVFDKKAKKIFGEWTGFALTVLIYWNLAEFPKHAVLNLVY
jgi:hypothetical protein